MLQMILERVGAAFGGSHESVKRCLEIPRDEPIDAEQVEVDGAIGEMLGFELGWMRAGQFVFGGAFDSAYALPVEMTEDELVDRFVYRYRMDGGGEYWGDIQQDRRVFRESLGAGFDRALGHWHERWPQSKRDLENKLAQTLRYCAAMRTLLEHWDESR